MAYELLDQLPTQFFDANGNPAVGYVLRFYINGTSTPAAIYFNSAGSSSATSVTINSLGYPANGGNQVQLYRDTDVDYKITLETAAAALVDTWEDFIYSAAESADVSYTDPLAPSYLKTLSDIVNGSEVSALRFISTAYHSAIRAHTSTQDLSTSFSDIVGSGARGIYFPYGRYQKNSATTPPSNQRWRGDGMDLTLIQMPQSNQTLNYNFLDNGSSDLSNFMMMDLTLKGSLDYQTSAATSGLVGFALYSRGAVNNVHFVRCKITKFGDQVNYSGGGGGGGIVLGHPSTSTTTGKESSNISAQFCVFDTNSNVPGFYLSQGGTGGTSNVKLIGNHFTGGYSSGSAQNCVYILGADATRIIENVVITGNTFRIGTSIDQCIELNWVQNFDVSRNPMRVLSGVTTCSGHILLRDGCISGVVGGNNMRDLSGNATAGISLVRFASPGTGTQEDITIDSNTIYGFDTGIQIDSGSAYGTANDNIIRACGTGFRLAACSDFEVSNNRIIACGYGAIFAGGSSGMRRVKYRHNDTYACTSSPYVGAVAGEDIEYLEFEHNTDSGSSGTYLFDINTAAATGNRFADNRSSLTPLNPSYLGDWAYIEAPDVTPITIADGTTSPNVRAGKVFTCAATAGTTISSLTGNAITGQEVTINLAVNWTVDFSGTTLKGNGGVDLTGTATNGIRCIFDGTNWRCDVIGA